MPENKQIVQSAMTAIYDDHDPDAAQRFFAPTLVQHSSVASDGVEGLEAFVDGLPANARHELHRSFAESDLVVTHASYTESSKARPSALSCGA